MIRITREQADFIWLYDIDLDVYVSSRAKNKKYYVPEAGVIFKILNEYNRIQKTI